MAPPGLQRVTFSGLTDKTQTKFVFLFFFVCECSFAIVIEKIISRGKTLMNRIKVFFDSKTVMNVREIVFFQKIQYTIDVRV